MWNIDITLSKSIYILYTQTSKLRPNFFSHDTHTLLANFVYIH